MNTLECNKGKAKLLAEIDKYEHELDTLEQIDSFPIDEQREILVERMQYVREMIEMCKQNLKEVENK